MDLIPSTKPTNPKPAPSPSPSGGAPPASASSTEPAPHVLAAAFPEPELPPEPGDEAPGPGAESGTAGAGGRIQRAEFRKAFVALFNGGAGVSGLTSLRVEGERVEHANAAADALYDTAEDVPWLRWLIEPGNVWVQRAVVMGSFAWVMGQGVAAELAERKKAAKPKPQGAPPGAAGPAEPEGPRSGYVHQDMAEIRPDGGTGNDD